MLHACMQCSYCHLVHDQSASSLLPYIGHIQQMCKLPFRWLCCAVLCCAVLCCAVLCCAVLCCAVLHHDANYATLAVNYYTCAPQAAAPNSNGAPNRLQSAGSQASSIAQCCCTHLTPVAKLLSSRSCPEFNIANPNCAKQQQECANCCQAV